VRDRRLMTPGPQSRRTAAAAVSTRSPEAGVSGWGRAGPDPMTVKRTGEVRFQTA
jgi:hypothetical protein